MTTGPDERAPGDLDEIAGRLRSALMTDDLDAAARSRHLHKIRERAAQLPQPARRARKRPGPSHWRPGWGALRRRLATGVVAVLAVGLVGSGVTAAAQDSLPGDALYPVKTSTEALALAVRADPGVRVEYLLRLAGRRLDEIEGLVARDARAERLADVVDELHRRLGEALSTAGDDPELESTVMMATDRALTRLEELLASVPDGQAGAALDRAIERLRERAGASAEPPGPQRRPATPGASGGHTPGGPSEAGRPTAPGPGAGSPTSGPERSGPQGPPADRPGPPAEPPGRTQDPPDQSADPPGQGGQPGGGTQSPPRQGDQPPPPQGPPEQGGLQRGETQSPPGRSDDAPVNQQDPPGPQDGVQGKPEQG